MKLERPEPSCHESKLTFLSCLVREMAKIAGPRGRGGISKGLCLPAFTTRAFEVTWAIVNTASLPHQNNCGLLASHPGFPNTEACRPLGPDLTCQIGMGREARQLSQSSLAIPCKAYLHV